jgi:drug/metabolite transporter (DMT)-like permease
LRSRPWQADGLLLFITVIWGATFPIVKHATDLAHGGVPTYWFVAARFSIAFLVLSAIFWRRLVNAPRGTWWAGALIGLFLGAGYIFQTLGLAHTTSAKAAFITGLNVVLVPVITVFWLKRRPSLLSWLGVGIATGGLGLLSFNGSSLLPGYGDLLVFLCAVAFALHIVAVGRFAGSHDTVALAIIQVGMAGAIGWSMHLFDKGTFAPGVTNIQWLGGPASVVAGLVLCSLLATALAFLLQNIFQPYTTPTHTALIFTAEPVWGALFAYLLASEVLPLQGYVGAGLILGGMLLPELNFGGKSQPTAAAGD